MLERDRPRHFARLDAAKKVAPIQQSPTSIELLTGEYRKQGIGGWQ